MEAPKDRDKAMAGHWHPLFCMGWMVINGDLNETQQKKQPGEQRGQKIDFLDTNTRDHTKPRVFNGVWNLGNSHQVDDDVPYMS